VKGHEGNPGGLVIACRDRAEFFDSAKEALDQMPGFVQHLVKLSGVLPMAFWRDHGCFTRCLQWSDHARIDVKSLVRQQSLRPHAGQQSIGSGPVMDLTRGQEDPQRVTQRTGQHVKFAAQTALSSADRLVLADFSFAPALC
jgi:hypothetical protein